MKALIVAVAMLVLVFAGTVAPAAAGGTDSATKTYCDAALKAARYTGPSATHLRRLLDPVVARAPTKVVASAPGAVAAELAAVDLDPADRDRHDRTAVRRSHTVDRHADFSWPGHIDGLLAARAMDVAVHQPTSLIALIRSL